MQQDTTPVSVVFAANDHYVPYLSALMASILANHDAERPLELIVLSQDLTAQHASVLREQARCEGATFTTIDVTEAMRPYEGKLRTWAHFKRETYFRLLLPQLLPNHTKVLYLDADMVCLHDVAELFDTNVDGFLIAACKDPDTTGIYNGIDIDVGQPNKRDYMDNILKIKNPYDYFQAGTILFNLEEWRRSVRVEDVFAFAQAEEWQLLDQDVLNYFCQGRVRFVSMAWNVMFDNGGFRISDIISRTTPELRKSYLMARENPYVVHFAGPFKPWDDPECDYAQHFWRYARLSPFYEALLSRLMEQNLARTDYDPRRLAPELRETRAQLQSVTEELRRFEHRPLGLMAKELVYQKMLTPVVSRLTGNNEGLRNKIRSLYRIIHPQHP